LQFSAQFNQTCFRSFTLFFSMSIDLTNKVCLITGADEGLGFGLVQGFLKRGAKVAAGLLQPERSIPLVAPAFGVPMDVTQPDQVEAAIAAVVARFGRIDVLINNAGIYPRIPADEVSPEDWLRVQDVNLNGTWRSCMAVLPHFKAQGSGSIINIGSVTFRLGMAHLSHYIASKGGVVGLTRGMTRDVGRFGIRVNCLHLGAIQTDGEKRLKPVDAAALAEVESLQSIPGRQTPESVEPTFAFFASDDSKDITGQCLTVDRGWIHE
jgi:3-oxoacyl-[acyl-carrier protein] reductase